MTFVKKQISPEKRLKAISSCPLFHAIPVEGLRLLTENCGYISYNAGDVLNYEGDTFRHCPFILSGQIEVFRYSSSGDEKIFSIFSESEIVAIAAVFMSHNRYPMSLRAKQNGAALLLDKKDILQLCQCYPALMEALLGHFSLKLYDYINHVDWLTSSSAEQRLAAYLLDLSHQQHSSTLTLPLSRGQLAAKLGFRYETLSRLFSGWRQKDIIHIKKNVLVIVNPQHLSLLAMYAQRPF